MNTMKTLICLWMLVICVSVSAQTKYLAIKKEIGNYVIADCMQKEPAKIVDQPDKVIYLYTAIFESSDVDGKKPICKIDQFDLVNNSNELLIVKQKDKFGIFDYTKGVLKESISNTSIKQFKISGNLLIEGKNVRIMDSKLNLIKSFPFKKTYSYLGEQFYDAAQNGKNAIIYNSIDGSVLYDLGNVKIEDVFEDIFIVERENKIGIMDVNKNILLPIKYSDYEFLDYSYDHLRIMDNRKEGAFEGLVKYQNGKIDFVIAPDFMFVLEVPPVYFKGDSIRYYRINTAWQGELLDKSGKLILTIKNASEALELEVVNDQYILGRDDSYDYFWVADENGNMVGNKYSNVERVAEKELKHHTIFTCERPYHSTIINDVTKKKFEYDDLIYYSYVMNNTVIFDSENGKLVYFKMNKERNDIEPLLANSMMGWSNEAMELPTGYITIQLAKNIFMVYDAFNDKKVAEGDLIKVRNETVKYIIAALNKEFEFKNQESDVVKNGNTCSPIYNSGTIGSYNYSVNGVELFGKDSLQHAVSFYRNFYVKNSKINIGTFNLYLDYSKPDLVLSAVFDDNYNMIVPFQDGMIQAFGNEYSDGFPDSYVIYSSYSDSMNVVLPKLNKRIQHKELTFMKVTEDAAAFHLFGNLLYIEDWMTDNSYLMDLSGSVIKKFKMGEVEMYDEDYIITYGSKSIIYFINARKEFLLEGQIAYRMTNTNILVMLNEMTDESKLYNIKTGGLIFNQKYDNISLPNKYYAVVSQGEKVAVLHTQQAKLMTDFNLTPEQAIEFIEKQADFLELQKQERMKHDELVKSGDKNFSSKRWRDALFSYTEAKKFTNEHSYLNQQIVAINKRIHVEDSMNLELDKKYLPIMAMGDSLMLSGKFSEAKAKFMQALQIKPNEYYPKEQIMKCDQAVKEQFDRETKNAALEKAFHDYMAQGNILMASKRYQEAIDSFTLALSMKPSDAVATTKLKECQDLLK